MLIFFFFFAWKLTFLNNYYGLVIILSALYKLSQEIKVSLSFDTF